MKNNLKALIAGTMAFGATPFAEVIKSEEKNSSPKNSFTKPTFYKNKQRAKVKLARKANIAMRKNK